MANFCPKCGRPLENNNFCMNCKEFARVNEGMQDAASYDTAARESNMAQNQAYSQPMNQQAMNQVSPNPASMDQQAMNQLPPNQMPPMQMQFGSMKQGKGTNPKWTTTQIAKNQTSSYQVPPRPSAPTPPPKPKEKLTAKQILLTIALIGAIIGISVVIIYFVSKYSKGSDRNDPTVLMEDNSENDSEDVSYDDISQYNEDDSADDAKSDANGDSSSEDTDTADDSQEEDINYLDADYDEIMATGESCNGYTHFSISKDEFVTMMDEYYKGAGATVEFSTDMDNYYENSEDGKITYYETYSVWGYTDDTKDQFYISTDTVTEELMYIAVNTTTTDRAKELITKSMQIADPSLLETEFLMLVMS